MKRTERQHLKDNEVAVFVSAVSDAIEERKQAITMIVAVIVIVGGAALGYYLWRDHVNTAAHTALAAALTIDDAPVGPAANPDAPEQGPRFATERAKAQAALTKFKVVADEYPSTDAGIYARYREASEWMQLGSPGEAASSYQFVIDKDGNGLYGQMARLGLAQAQAASGQYDQAVSTYKALAEQTNPKLPVDGILMELGRTYMEAGKTADAQQTFNKIVQEYPDSPFSVEAKQMLDGMKKAA